jgi:hypothetical protein
MQFSLQVLSALLSIAAAVLWLRASLLPAPERLKVIIGGEDGFGGELPELFSAFRRQSRWNAFAASCASGSALMQGLAFFVGQ